VLVPAALALIAGVATASSPPVTITSPKEGQSPATWTASTRRPCTPMPRSTGRGSCVRRSA